MKQNIRLNTFETNSSSTHSVSIIPEKYWECYKNNKIVEVFDELAEELGTRWASKEEIKASNWFKKNFDTNDYVYLYETEEEIDEAIEDIEKEFFKDHELYFYEYIFDGELEYDITDYTSESGDKIKIVCQYGCQ